jgi:hypothetical protein
LRHCIEYELCRMWKDMAERGRRLIVLQSRQASFYT